MGARATRISSNLVLLWPIVLAVSGLAAGVVVLLHAPEWVRLPITLWFLLICPGMAVVQVLAIEDPIIEWGLAVILSLSLELLAALALLYAGHWSPNVDLVFLIVVSLTGGLLQALIVRGRHPRVSA